MQTSIAPALADDPRVIASEKILRKCVHCGFCLATCPTYTLLGDELDSPRGRIYLIKQVVEGQRPTSSTLTHLDRCLTCRNCETTCPSGVEYGHLVDQGRALVEERVTRPLSQRLLRKLILASLPYRRRMAPFIALGQSVRGLLPAALKASVPAKQRTGHWPRQSRQRKMLILEGCVQPGLTPATNHAAARVLDTIGIQLVPIARAGCCGAIHHHLNEQADARDFMRRNIDAWWRHIDDGAEAIVTTASGCGVMVKDYATVLADDPDYADRARRVSELCVDIVEVLSKEDLSMFHERASAVGRIAFHPPCTLQHGQKLPQVTESLLRKLGFELTPIQDEHLCCGSAGTYSIFQPELSQQFRDNKVQAILDGKPDVIATANIGCQLHLQTGLGRPVVHWIELIDALLAP